MYNFPYIDQNLNKNAFGTNRNKTNLIHSHSCVSIINLLLYSISISYNRSLPLRLQAVRNNLRSTFPILLTPKSSNEMQFVCGSRALSVTRSSTPLLDRHGFGPHSSRNANQRASVVGVRGSFANSLPFSGTTPPDSHMPSLPSANSILFPAKASGFMQYFRIPAATSPIHTLLQSASSAEIEQPRIDGQLTADPAHHPFPAVRPGQQAVIFAEPVRGTNDAGAGHDFAEHFLAFGRFCGREKPRLLWFEPTPNHDGGSAAEPTRGGDASCTARCRFWRDARGSR